MKLLFAFCFTLIFIVSHSSPVNKEQAIKTAKKWLIINSNLIETDLENYNLIEKKVKEHTVLYIINFNNSFVITSADNSALPIIAYSTENKFKYPESTTNINFWLEGISLQIYESIKSGHTNKKAIDQWTHLKALEVEKTTKNGFYYVTALWGQGCYYNALCPSMCSTNCEHALTGCGATAMAIIFRFYRYTNETDYLTNQYDWTSISNASLSGHNSDVANLMHECGVAQNAVYGCSSTSSWISDIEQAFFSDFDYPDADLIERDNFTTNNWINTLKQELNNQRIVFYSGEGTGGHGFVADGYDDNNFFHFNWGWNGSANGYYSLDDLTPGSSSFNSNQLAIIGLAPCKYEYDINYDFDNFDQTFIASNSVSSTSTISNNSVVEFSANVGINLLNGFKVNQGCSFIASLNGCTVNTKGNHISTTDRNNDISTTNYLSFEIYPNPNNGIFNIHLQGYKKSAEVSIYNSLGAKIKILNIGNSVTVTDISEQPPGIYIVKLQTGNEVFTEKIIYK